MRFVSGLLWFLYKILVAVTLLVYALAYWTPSAHWLAGFLMMSLPVWLVVHLAFLLFWLLAAPSRAMLPFLILLVSFPFWSRTLQLDFFQEQDTATAVPQNTLKVLNYNVYKFNMFAYREKWDTVTTLETRRWLADLDADVLCFQEFYHYANIPALDFRGLLRKAGYRYQAFNKNEFQGDSPYRTGLAVFSRYPIVAQRDTTFGRQNGLLQVDIVWRDTTIRIIDVHLFSMTLNLSDVAAQREYDGFKRETGTTLRLMQRGFSERGKETQALERWLDDTAQPVIVCGDFNETAYSYPYGRLKKRFANAFEESGRGFGFTYRYLPYFVRIDHQFYDWKRLQLVDFKTLKDVKYSDHYPLLGSYVLK